MELIIQDPIAVAVTWAILYLFDYYSTIWFARFVRTTLGQYITFEHGIEMNPIHEKDVSNERRISWRFALLLISAFVLILSVGYLLPFNIELIAGLFLLTWLFVDMRHLRNYFYAIQLKRRPDAMSGHLSQSYWISQRLLSFDALSFAVFCLAAWLVTYRTFFIGGILTCTALFVRHYLLANRKFHAKVVE